jgi:hypothetical protein
MTDHTYDGDPADVIAILVCVSSLWCFHSYEIIQWHISQSTSSLLSDMWLYVHVYMYIICVSMHVNRYKKQLESEFQTS